MDKEHQLRCYSYKKKQQYYAVCIDLTLIDEGATLEAARTNLQENVLGYLECVSKNGTMKQFFPRKAPFAFRLHYYWVRLLATLFPQFVKATLFEFRVPQGDLRCA